MSDNKKRRSDGEPFVERRSRNSGITSGGRRKSDRRMFGVGGKKSRVWILLSFTFSAIIMAWAFTAPFRGDNAIQFGNETDDVEARPVSRLQQQKAKDDYVRQMMYLEDDLKLQVEEKQRIPRNLPGKEHSRKQWKKGLERRVNDAKLLSELAEGDIDEGTIEWHAQQDLKDYLEDAPQ